MIKLADFGLSRRISEISSNQKDVFGMIPYIDPQYFKEQADSNDNTLQKFRVFSRYEIHVDTISNRCRHDIVIEKRFDIFKFNLNMLIRCRFVY